MRGEDVVELFENKVLRNYLCASAKNFSRNPELQEDLLQEAWLRICEKPAGRTIKYYIHQGYCAMDSAYRKELRTRRLSKDAIHKRSKRREKKAEEIYQKVSEKGV